MGLLATVLVYAVLNASGLLLLRVALQTPRGGDERTLGALLSDPRLFAGGLLYVLGFVTWLATLRTHPLSTVYPIFVGVGYASVVIASLWLLDERATVAKVGGLVLIGLGLIFVAR